MTRIGVKYCGGCDPNYERVERVEKLAEKLKSHVQVVSYREPPYEILLVVNGCHKQCAELDSIPETGAKVIFLADQADWLEKYLLAKIEEII